MVSEKMAVVKYSNTTIIGILLIFVTTLSFVAGKPITEFQFWEENRQTLTPWICSFFSVFVVLFTLNKQSYFAPHVESQPEEQKLTVQSVKARIIKLKSDMKVFKTRAIYIFGNLLILSIATASQYMLRNLQWEGIRCFEVFVVSNLVMTTIFNIFMAERAIETHVDNPFQLLIPVYTFATTYLFINTPGESWLYHYYYNLLTAACAVELYAAFDHEIFRSPQRKNQVRVKPAEVVEESDVEYESAPSSDSEWERVEEAQDQ